MAALTLALGCGGPAAEPAPATPPPVQVPAEVMGAIVGRNVAWGSAYNGGNAAALARLYTSDAVIMTPQGDLVGREAIEAHFAQLFAARTDSVLSTDTATEALDVAGDRAYESGTLTRTLRPRADSTAPARELRLRYATWWQRDGATGEWQIRRSLRAP